MSNKQFFIFFGVVIAAFFGWLYYDSNVLSPSSLDEKVQRDVLEGEGADSSAQIQYVFRFPETLYDHTHSIPEIEALSSKLGEEQNFHVPALTQAEFGLKTYYQFNYSKKMFQDNYSLWVENLKVDFSYNKMTVYITASYPEGSCEYKTTIDHENEHVAIHSRIYEKYKKILQKTLADSKNIPLADHPVVVKSLDEGKTQIAELITTITDPIFNQFQDELSQEQADLDSPTNYSMLKERCSNW